MADDTPLPLRDLLAMDRTALANERTLLAYVRTAVALLAGGIGLTQFIPHAWALWVGSASLALGVVVGLVGLVRFATVSRRIRRETRRRQVQVEVRPPPGSPPPQPPRESPGSG